MSIGDNIKKWREIRCLKQSELAEILGVSDKTISSWEINRTEPKIGMIERISEALRCKNTDIIGIDDGSLNEAKAYLLTSEAKGNVDKINKEILEMREIIYEIVNTLNFWGLCELVNYFDENLNHDFFKLKSSELLDFSKRSNNSNTENSTSL